MFKEIPKIESKADLEKKVSAGFSSLKRAEKTKPISMIRKFKFKKLYSDCRLFFTLYTLRDKKKRSSALMRCGLEGKKLFVESPSILVVIFPLLNAQIIPCLVP